MWKAIKGYEGYYEVNPNGEIRSLDRQVNYKNNKKRVIKSQIKKQTLNEKGYLKITLWKDHKEETKEVQRIVAETFIENPNNLPQVNHIDGNKTNNKVKNLEWCSEKDNSIHRTKILKKGIKTIIQFDLNNKCVGLYESLKEASIKTGIKSCSISNVINLRRKTAGGYYWTLA